MWTLVYTHRMREVFILVLQVHLDPQQALERLLHLLAVSRGVVAEDEVEGRCVVRLLHHDVLQRRDGIRVLAHLDEDGRNVLHDLHSVEINVSTEFKNYQMKPMLCKKSIFAKDGSYFQTMIFWIILLHKHKIINCILAHITQCCARSLFCHVSKEQMLLMPQNITLYGYCRVYKAVQRRHYQSLSTFQLQNLSLANTSNTSHLKEIKCYITNFTPKWNIHTEASQYLWFFFSYQKVTICIRIFH